MTDNDIDNEIIEDAPKGSSGALLSLLEDDLGRTFGIYGEINEESCSTVISHLYALRNSGKYTLSHNNEEIKEECDPLEMIISSEGGHVTEMFAVYDVMRQVQQECEIHTMGLGKVMSAGVLLLAAGTTGKRKIGKHCRLMLHSIAGGDFGSIRQLENNIKEVKWYQQQYIEALSRSSNMSMRQLKAIFRKKSDTYFDAAQALKWGIVDEIV
tara:strand:+ start:1460 stop:2095 length:636 start_codon:yes stop_codon:yes gene_type:complete